MCRVIGWQLDIAAFLSSNARGAQRDRQAEGERTVISFNEWGMYQSWHLDPLFTTSLKCLISAANDTKGYRSATGAIFKGFER